MAYKEGSIVETDQGVFELKGGEWVPSGGPSLFDARGYTPQPGEAQAMGGSAAQAFYEPLATMASAVPAEIAAGYSGLLGLAKGGPQAGEDAVRQTRESLTYTPRSEAGMTGLLNVGKVAEPIGKAFDWMSQQAGDYAYKHGLPTPMGIPIPGSPATGAIGAAIPELAMQLTGIGVARRAIPKDVPVSPGMIEPPTAPTEIPMQTQRERIVEAVKAQKPKDINIKPDPEIIRAAEELGIDLNPSHYSTSRAYQEVEQALKSRPSTLLGEREQKAIEALSGRANSIVQEMGATDASILDYSVKTDFTDTINRLSNQSGPLYDLVAESIPRSTIIKPTNARKYINSTLEDLGGNVKRLSKPEAALLEIIDENPTYAALDRLRKDIGDGFKNKGPFKDESSSTLSAVYAALSEDQMKSAKAFGVDNELKQANKLVQERKAIEDQAIQLFGKEIDGSIIPALSSAAGSLSKGDISRFDKLMKAIPENRRSEAAGIVLSKLFMAGSKKEGVVGGGFPTAFNNLNKNTLAKQAIMSYLSPEARIRFNNIGRVATGIYKAKTLENTSRTAASVIQALEDGGLIGKIYKVGRTAAMAEGATTSVGMPGVGTAGVLAGAMAKGKTAPIQAADEFLTSVSFESSIRQSMKGNAKAAQNILNKSQKYKTWLTHLSPQDAKQIASVGFVTWLTQGNEDGR